MVMDTATAPPTRLVLIRHGESRSTVERIVGGHRGCTGLSERGRLQAEALRDRLARTGELAETSVLLTSILPRAIETAKIIAPALGDLAADEHCDLCEIHPGDEGDGLAWEEFEERYRKVGTASRNPYAAAAPDGESWASFFVRAGAALQHTAQEHRGQTVVIVAHGGIIEASFASLGNQPLQRGFHLHIDNTSITEWFRAEGDERWKLMRFNDAAHLRD
jgi:probable phosphoglycerate mutase